MVDKMGSHGDGYPIIADEDDNDHRTVDISVDTSAATSQHDTDDTVIIHGVDSKISDAMEVNHA